ncbi:MAG: ATP-binding protein [Pseudomonadota bacterium]
MVAPCRVGRRARRRHGYQMLVTAHHAQDQAETMMMYSARANGTSWPMGMRMMQPLHDCFILRPCLLTMRDDLRNALHDTPLAAHHDPANLAPRFTRSLWRQYFDRHPAPQRLIMDLCNKARAAQKKTKKRQSDWQSFAMISLSDAGFAVLGREIFASDKGEAALHAILPAIGGYEHAPKRKKLRNVCAHILTAQGGQHYTLGGCRIFIRKSTIMILREHASPAMPCRGAVLWDNRFVIPLLDGDAGVVWQVVSGDKRMPLPKYTPAHLRKTLPMLAREDRVLLPDLSLFQDMVPPSMRFPCHFVGWRRFQQ